MKGILVGTALGLSTWGGCGSGVSYTVGGQTLSVKSTAYITGMFLCQAGLAGQLEVALVDYSPICGADDPLGSDGGTADGNLEHNELDLLFMMALHDDKALPYAVGPSDCTNGPVSDGTATFRHYGTSGTAPVDTQAVGGAMFLTSFDPTGVEPAQGSFTLDFGMQGSIAGKFSAPMCN